MAQGNLGELLTDTRVNAGLSWVLVALFVLVTVESVLTRDFLWATFTAIVGLMVVLPALVWQSPRAMPPWEMVLLAGLPVVSRAVARFQVTSTISTYLSIAALALLIAVNLHLFTSVEMSVGFAVLFVVVTTLAAAGLWALARWGSDLYFGTELLLAPGPDGTLDRGDVEHALMVEFVASGVAGLVAGLVFERYILRRMGPGERITEEIA